MENQLTRLQVENFRSLADVSVDVHPINVFFGPNGSGKSTLLEAIRLVKDCISRDVEEAARTRNNGFGMLRQGVDEFEGISIVLETAYTKYALQLGFSRGQIFPHAGELLYSDRRRVPLINRRIGSDQVNFYYRTGGRPARTPLTFPEKTCFDSISARKGTCSRNCCQSTKSARLCSFLPFSLYRPTRA